LIGSHYLAQFFGVELGGESGRAYQITEHDRELAAFGLWSRRVWRLESRVYDLRNEGLPSKRRTALAAKIARQQVGGLAARAGFLKLGPTLRTKDRIGQIFVLTLWALHIPHPSCLLPRFLRSYS
jgi:hypothetical protein